MFNVAVCFGTCVPYKTSDNHQILGNLKVLKTGRGVELLRLTMSHCFFFHSSLQSALISEDKAAQFRHQVYLPITLTKVVEYVLIGLGALFILVALVLLFLTVKKTKRIEMRIINTVDDTIPLFNFKAKFFL